MRRLLHCAPALALPALLTLVAAARAEATIDAQPVVTVRKGRTFLVEADVTMASSGTVTLRGTVGGRPYELTKRFKTRKAKTKTVRFKVDPKRFGLHDETDAIVLTALVAAAEEGQPEPATATGGASLPPPLMIVPGLGSELDDRQFTYVFLPFRDALNENAGSPWLTKGARRTLSVERYFTTSYPLEQLGADIARRGERMLKKSALFARLDLVGQSTGGIVVRQAMLPAASAKAAPSLAGRVRHVFFFGTPQSGTPLAYLAQQALLATKDLPNGIREPTLEALAEKLAKGIDSPSAASLAALLLRPALQQGDDPPFLGVVEMFLPTYAFARIPTGSDTTAFVDLPTLTGLAGTPQLPVLHDLNGSSPDPDAVYHAFYYSDVAGATGDIRTVDGLDFVAFLAGGATDFDLVTQINGAGDGVASEVSTLLTAHPQWNAALNAIDLGDGLHFPDESGLSTPGYYNDPNVLGYVLQRVLSPLPSDSP